MHLLNGFLIFCLFLFCPFDGFSKMYKWVDEDGKVHFTDQEPPEEATEVKQYGKEPSETKRNEAKKPESPYTLDLEVLDIKVKLLERHSEHVDFSLGVKVRCSDPNFKGDVKVWLRALDKKGFELGTATAKGQIVSGGSAILSGKNWFKYKIYKQIDKWELSDMTFF